MKTRNGFTLVELVVVIMILGILAGVAAPRMLNTANMATENGVRQTLAIVRDAIELYAADHGGELPSSAANLATELEDYIRGDFPASPVADADASGVTQIAAGDPADGESGWCYDPATGDFRCNSTKATSVAGTTYEDL